MALRCEHRMRHKIIILGNAGVGKTSLIRRFSNRSLYDQLGHLISTSHDPDVIERNLLVNGNLHCFEIWDTVGQELYRSVPITFYHNVKGVFLVYDVSSKDSIDGLEYWDKEMAKNEVYHPATCVILGNKCDLIGGSDTTPVRDLPRNATFSHFPLKFETSAKCGTGIDMALQTLCENIVNVPGMSSCDEHYQEILSKHQFRPKSSKSCC